MFNLEKSNRTRDLWGGYPFFDKEMDKYFGSLQKSDEFHAPACEIVEEEKHYLVSMDVPGMREEDISVELKDNYLYISGERKFESKVEKKNVLKTEKRYGKFSRAFTLPQDVTAELISAKFRNGVIEVIIPKAEKAQARKISITTVQEGQ